MKTRGMATLILAGCLLAGAADAQMAPGMHSAPKAGRAKKVASRCISCRSTIATPTSPACSTSRLR